MGRVRSRKRRVRDDDFIVDYRRIILDYRRIIFGLSSNRLYIGGSIGGAFTWDLPLQDYVAGAVFGEAGVWLFVAGAVFGEGGVWLFVAGAPLRDILGDSRSAKCCILQYKIVSKMGRVRSRKRRVRDDDFIVDYRRIILDYRRIIVGLSSNRLYIGGSIGGTFTWDLPLQDYVAGAVFGEVGVWLYLLRALEMTFHMWRTSLMTFIVWQAQYLVRLAGDCTCSAHWKWRFICDAHHWWLSFCVAGAVFGEVGGWLYSAHWKWKWRFICNADHWWHSFCVAGAVFGEVGGWLYLLRTLEMTFHMWRGVCDEYQTSTL